MPTPEDRPTPLTAPKSWLTTLGWSAYLACSWTWCIGMFLPVLLVRDFGIWGFIVFAVPNVVGAAAMGWALRDASVSIRLLSRHALACKLFSWVTIAFQAFFAFWLVQTGYLTGSRLLVVFAAGFLGLSLVRAAWRWVGRADPMLVASGMFWLLSAMLFVACLLLGGRPPIAGEVPPRIPQDVLWLAPVCLFGFALCPYLDVSFHVARQATDLRQGRAAFSVGFGLLFAIMLLFTLSYVRVFDLSLPQMALATTAGVLPALVVIHIILQLSFTARLHWSLVKPDSQRRQHPLAMAVFALAICVGLAALARVFRDAPLYAGLSVGEITYRLFMSFYGLVFPAYVWLCVIPTRSESATQPPSRAKLIILFTSVTLAAPFYWMGFIERQTWYLAPGLAIVLFARLFLPRPALTPPPSPSSV